MDILWLKYSIRLFACSCCIKDSTIEVELSKAGNIISSIFFVFWELIIVVDYHGHHVIRIITFLCVDFAWFVYLGSSYFSISIPPSVCTVPFLGLYHEFLVTLCFGPLESTYIFDFHWFIEFILVKKMSYC